MPIYEYQCLGCKNRFEELIGFLEANSVQCPKCKSSNCQKLISLFGIGGGSTTSSSSCGTCSLPSCTSCR